MAQVFTREDLFARRNAFLQEQNARLEEVKKREESEFRKDIEEENQRDRQEKAKCIEWYISYVANSILIRSTHSDETQTKVYAGELWRAYNETCCKPGDMESVTRTADGQLRALKHPRMKVSYSFCDDYILVKVMEGVKAMFPFVNIHIQEIDITKLDHMTRGSIEREKESFKYKFKREPWKGHAFALCREIVVRW